MIDPVGRSAAVIGGGPAGLIAAETLARAGVSVTVYDRMASAGRKFLLAGRGGLNLTHSEPLDAFLNRYGTTDPRLRAAIAAFPPGRVRAWCEELGQPTFVGSSGRVFPKVAQDLAALAGLVAPARPDGRRVHAASPLDRLGG